MTPSEPAAALEDVPCALCGGARGRLLFERPYSIGPGADISAMAATTDEFREYGRIVRCAECGLAYTNPRPRAGTLLKAYADCKDEIYLEESSSRSINAHLSVNTIKRHARSGKLLDVGAATGYFLNAARVDFDVLGLEPSEWACRIGRERFKLEMICGTLESAELEAGTFDVVAMIDVIEHVADPKDALLRAARLLKTGGILYLVTPDIGSLSARLLRSRWWGLRPAHIYYFDRSTMGRMLAQAGLEPVMSKSFGRIFSYGYWASRLRNYPAWARLPVERAISILGLEEKLLYIDTRDSMELCARKP